MTMPTVRNDLLTKITANVPMSEKWLEENGFDGLYNVSAGCACERADFLICSEDCSFKDCKPGVYKNCRTCRLRQFEDCSDPFCIEMGTRGVTSE